MGGGDDGGGAGLSHQAQTQTPDTDGARERKERRGWAACRDATCVVRVDRRQGRARAAKTRTKAAGRGYARRFCRY
jgi:hypothetical protein